MAEWKWDGIRAQVIRGGANTFVWSRANELITEPKLPDGIAVEGELIG
jgi:DNA ligase-1